ncbi:MAG: oxygen-independent coproporphyrinogen III oxidase [Gammaproteobacteria bacterium]|nr:oxygen-independent coproporphyrinogen III oxidase [Gammaproteobacteria bacterium]NNF49849.1 oxygen-independent coproporphyrinogen III oxidase [Woeseiaceae bacterium]MBT8094671.1 oxygen-independent coproporphyrinogen III oxidase [Gammaproteobacteria bacterium]MBT8105839.1 oxygen-independent coproporphyrinogen III oxidase [Gammaproteobacteria bacterium]NNK25853.1 oxygen-independent coproporphyrinogen III oxidase [Woeseiaceae bacterium]
MDVCFDQDLIVRYGGRGPRYTSYPTALQFTDTLTADDYREAAKKSNDSDVPLSLYVHIPFCHSLCYYCGCNKIVTRNEERVARYMEMLYREIEMQSALFDRSRKVEQLHFGGGTPTYLDEQQLGALMAHLRASFNFDESDNREFSIEVDPRTVDEQRIRELWDLGFNRLSLGIQDFNEDVQKAVNRAQSPAEVRALVDAARDAGFGSISFDLIYGLPHQTVESFNTTLDIVVGMQPDRLAVYNYAHLPQRFKGQRMINADDIPAPETKLDLLRHTIEKLCGVGFVYIGMDHFALPDDELVIARGNGTLQRNFQGYSTHRHCDLIALGVSGIGGIGNMFAQNSITTMEYEEIIERGELPIRKGLIVDDDDLVRAAVIQDLMCYDRLDYEDFGQRIGIDFREYFADEVAKLDVLEQDGLIELSDAGIEITPKGRLLLRNIAMTFDRYIDLAENDSRFSKAI